MSYGIRNWLLHSSKRTALMSVLFVCIFTATFLIFWSRPEMNAIQFVKILSSHLWTKSKESCYFQRAINDFGSISFSPSNWDSLLTSEALTGNQIMKYFMWTNRSSCQLVQDFGGTMLKNPSGWDGQKSVCLDPKVAPQPGKCLVYSFGINNEWSFDEQMSNYGCEVFSFDPSMGMAYHNHSPGNVHFYNWGLGDQVRYDVSNNWRILSLSSIYEKLSSRHGSRIIDYLKIDIEYSEWEVLPDIIKSGMLSKVRQLAIEFHLDSQSSLDHCLTRAKLLRSIEKMGMVRFDSEYNPWFIGNFTQLKLFGQTQGYEIAWYNNNLTYLSVASSERDFIWSESLV